MSQSLSDLILRLLPEDGSTIGNGAMMALLREKLPGLTEDKYTAARDALVDEGLLGRGKGRGGSIFRIIGDDEDDADDTEDDFELTAPEEAAPRPRKAQPAGTRAGPRKSGEPVQVVSYRHGETRVNNPEVGMVHAGTDPDGAKTTWAMLEGGEWRGDGHRRRSDDGGLPPLGALFAHRLAELGPDRAGA